MRITKEFDERRQEIIDKSSILFSRKGYEKTSVADIVTEVNVAKGTFYYYFKSKEDVLDALIEQKVKEIGRNAQAIADNSSLNVKEKLFQIILGNDEKTSENDRFMDENELKEVLHIVDNEKLHIKSIKATINELVPIITQVIEQGIQEDVFKTEYPFETVELLLVSSSFLFDKGIFQWKSEEIMKKIIAFIHIMEVSLGAEQGSLTYLSEVIQYSE